jgi:hypothetical protein
MRVTAGRAARSAQHCPDCPVDVGCVHAGERVTQVDGYAVRQARREPQDSSLASAAGKAAIIEGGYRGWPVDQGHEGRAVSDARLDVHEAVAEVVAAEPGCVADEELCCGFGR